MNSFENDKNAFNLKYQIETTVKPLKEANKKINSLNGKRLIHITIVPHQLRRMRL